MNRPPRKPGRSHREGIPLPEFAAMFPDDDAAEAWFVKARWPRGCECPHCRSANVAQVRSRKPQPFRCRACRKYFSVKTGTVMHGSKLGLRVWAYAFYLFMTSVKGVSSMKLSRDLGVSQPTAWHLGHRVRLALGNSRGSQVLFKGPVEADETYIGGSDHNRHASAKRDGPGGAGKAPVAGMRDRATGQVRAEAVPDTTKHELQGYLAENVAPTATVFTDEHPSYQGMANPHQTVNHSAKQWVDGQAHTNGVESFWALLKRGYEGVYHCMSAKHLDRYVQEFANRQNLRKFDTIVQMRFLARRMVGRRIRFADLIAANA